MAAPDLYAYADYRRYLTDWFEAQKEGNPRFSHRIMARKLGITDPSALLNVMKGRRRLGDDRIEALARALDLEDEQVAYFRALVDFGQAPDAEARNRAFGVLAELRSRHLPPEVDPARFALLTSWVVPAVRELARLKAFREDPVWIAEQLDPPISPLEAAQALQLVERLGFLRRESGKLVVAEPTVRTSPTVAALSSYPWHRDAHVLGARALERVHDAGEPKASDETAFIGCTISVPTSRIHDVRTAIFEMLGKLLHETEGWTEQHDRVVQVAINLYPVTRQVEKK